jgi:hypothetical protein
MQNETVFVIERKDIALFHILEIDKEVDRHIAKTDKGSYSPWFASAIDAETFIFKYFKPYCPAIVLKSKKDEEIKHIQFLEQSYDAWLNENTQNKI